MMLIGTYILIGVAIVGVGMFTVMQVDEFFYKRKRIREINDRHEERMSEMSVRHAEFMLRMGMNPGYMSRNLPLCTASRQPLLTAVSPEAEARRQAEVERMREALNVPAWDGVAVQAESLVRFQTELTDLPAPKPIPGWDGTFIHLDENEDAIPAHELFSVKEKENAS